MRALSEIGKVKRFIALILWCFLSLYSSSAQTVMGQNTFTGTIYGVVIDSATQTTLGQATVMVQELKNTQFRKNTVTNENGYFELNGLPNRQYQLVITSIGYKPKIVVLPGFTSSTISIGKTALVARPGYLNTVLVTAPKQLIEQHADKIIYNVDVDPESQTSTALDMLQKIPLLTLDAEGNLRMNGNSSYQVLINGKPSALFLRNPGDVFKNMPASIIKTIEVITMPSSRYEAKGVGGIINITTYKKSIGGYNAGINIGVSNPGSFTVSSTMSATLGKFDLSGNCSFNNSTNPVSSNTFYWHDKLQLNRLEQTGVNSSTNASQSMGGELTWMMNARNLLTCNYGRNNTNEKANSLQQAKLLNASDEIAEAYQNIHDGIYKSRNDDFTFDYQHNFKNEDQQFLLSCRWSNSINESNSDFVLEPLINYNERQSISNDKDEFREGSIQADYVQPIKKHSLEMGVSAIFRQSNSDYFYKDRDPLADAFVLDSSQSNNFNYEENMYAGYLSLNLRKNKWGLRTGARLELAKVDAHFISSGTNAIQQYLNLIPNVILLRQLKGVSTIKLAYSQRLQRPGLSNLNPYLTLTGPRNISYGNPGLQPALAHVFELTFNAFVKRFSINISAFHQFVNNSIQPFTILGNDTIARTTYGNIGKSQISCLSVSGNIMLFKKLSININSAFNYMLYRSTIGNNFQTSEGLTYNVSGLLNLRLKNWRMGANMSYNAPNILAQGRAASFISGSGTINRYLFKNKVNIGLMVNNPFHKYRHSFNEINDPVFYQLRETFNALRRYNLAINYRFSKVQSNSKTSK